MAFSSIFKKASSLLGFGGPSLKPPPLDGEIIYCKNNVCVHPPATLTSDKEEHHQGYLTLRSTNDKINGPSLILTWIPNSTLKKNAKSIENSPNKSQGTTPKTSPRRTPRQEFAKPDGYISTPTTSLASLSPMSPIDCCVNLGSERGTGGNRRISKEIRRENGDVKLRLGTGDSVEKDFEHENGSPEQQRKMSAGSETKLDSGIAMGPEDGLQNNCKSVSQMNKHVHVGQHVNDLYTSDISKINTDLNNLTKAIGDVENSDDGTLQRLNSEEKLASMLNRNKLHSKPKERNSSNRSVSSVSIEMDGDNIVITTEELVDDVLMDTKDTTLEQKNTNKSDEKFESSSTDHELNSISSESSDPNLSSYTGPYEKVTNEIRDDLNITDTDPSKLMNLNGSKEDFQQKVMGSSYQYQGVSGNRDSLTVCTSSSSSSSYNPPQHPQSLNLSSINTTASNNNSITTPDISVTRMRNDSGSSTTTSGPDSTPPSPYSSSPENSEPWTQDEVLDSPCSIDSMSHNLQFPEMSVSKRREDKEREREKRTAKEQVCGVFSVDLGQMRSLRLFYSNSSNTKGQIVIASRESQYKILHFHHGGLDKLAEIFQDWSLFASHQEKLNDSDKCYRQFMIVKPQLTDDQCHPEEGVYSMVSEDIWRTHMMDEGNIEDDYQLRKAIFFGGLEPCLRHEAWPFLLHYFPFLSTFEEREQIRNDRYIEYQDIRKKRESMSEEEQETFWRNVQCTVEKDVVRTDRSHPYFKGENNPNIEVLKNILLNYAVANPMFGYTQGMSDLLAPVLAEVQHEVDSYWCFVGLMQKTIFVSSPKDCDMDRQLTYLRELLRQMQPTFYDHLRHLGDDAMELLFAHRWILLCFKREFNEKDALRIWEACWSHYQTDYFHLFICVAIVCIYGEDVVEQCLPADEILLHFSSLACHMSGELVLRKARGLLHEYRRRPVIPCTLHGLCSLCGQGMWDSGHVPTVECVGSHLHGECPYLSPKTSPTTMEPQF